MGTPNNMMGEISLGNIELITKYLANTEEYKEAVDSVKRDSGDASEVKLLAKKPAASTKSIINKFSLSTNKELCSSEDEVLTEFNTNNDSNEVELDFDDTSDTNSNNENIQIEDPDDEDDSSVLDDTEKQIKLLKQYGMVDTADDDIDDIGELDDLGEIQGIDELDIDIDDEEDEEDEDDIDENEYNLDWDTIDNQSSDEDDIFGDAEDDLLNDECENDINDIDNNETDTDINDDNTDEEDEIDLDEIDLDDNTDEELYGNNENTNINDIHVDEHTKQLEDRIAILEQKLNNKNADIAASSNKKTEKVAQKEKNTINLNNKNNSSKALPNIDNNPYYYYDNMEIEALAKEVKEYLYNLGVKQRIITFDEINPKFGEHNIRKLILKSYIVEFKNGVTCT